MHLISASSSSLLSSLVQYYIDVAKINQLTMKNNKNFCEINSMLCPKSNTTKMKSQIPTIKIVHGLLIYLSCKDNMYNLILFIIYTNSINTMSINKDKHYEIIELNNTAQADLVSILDTYSKEVDTLRINVPLHGDLNLSDLANMGFGKIKHIIIGKGEITNLILPKNIETLECVDNLLLKLDNLPKSLININVSYNILEHIDVSTLSNLETLNVSHNKLTTVENLPQKITEFVCEFNEIEYLDLAGLSNLTKLYLSNNNITLIENQPDSIIDIQIENNPSITFRNSQNENISGSTPIVDDFAEQQRNYKDAINEYFKLKNRYESDLMDMKRKAYKSEPNKRIAKRLVLQVKPKCIKCKRPVGTIFSKNENRYEAICGDASNPCSLDIQIFPGFLTQFQILFDMVKQDFDAASDNLLKQKLDTLFNYISEDQSVALFKKELQLYNESGTYYKEYLEKYNELYNNAHRNETIQNKSEKVFRSIETSNQLIEEYKKTSNYEFLKSAVELQVRDIIPEMRNIRMLKHHIMEMVRSDEDDDEPGKIPIHTLFQRPASIAELDYASGEQQRVIKFNI